MNADDFIMEDCRATWRADAQNRANKDAENAGFSPNDSSETVRQFITERYAKYYAELEKIGLENIQ